jgi:hypothetical protein
MSYKPFRCCAMFIIVQSNLYRGIILFVLFLSLYHDVLHYEWCLISLSSVLSFWRSYGRTLYKNSSCNS